MDVRQESVCLSAGSGASCVEAGKEGGCVRAEDELRASLVLLFSFLSHLWLRAFDRQTIIMPSPAAGTSAIQRCVRLHKSRRRRRIAHSTLVPQEEHSFPFLFLLSLDS